MYTPVKKKPKKIIGVKYTLNAVIEHITKNSPGNPENRGNPRLAIEKINHATENTGNVSPNPESLMLSL